jgi:hypothetical protein
VEPQAQAGRCNRHSVLIRDALPGCKQDSQCQSLVQPGRANKVRTCLTRKALLVIVSKGNSPRMVCISAIL